MKCVAVVVTYNRLSLLKRTLEGIQRQTRVLDTIVVVNNGSTDGTHEWLEEQSALDVIHQENVGGAGGFEAGMKYAFDHGADWIWAMDDDVVPKADALQKLLAWRSCSGCMVPARVYADGKPCNWGYVFDLRKRSIVFGTRPSEQDPGKSVTVVNTACFEGMVISRRIVERAGFPDPRFFISGDDTTYGLRVSRLTNILYVQDAILVRAKDSAAALRISPIFAYYHFRNFHLLEEHYRELSGGKRYGLLWHGKYLMGAGLALKRCWQHNRSDFPAVARAIARGIRDSYLKKTGASY